MVDVDEGMERRGAVSATRKSALEELVNVEAVMYKDVEIRGLACESGSDAYARTDGFGIHALKKDDGEAFTRFFEVGCGTDRTRLEVYEGDFTTEREGLLRRSGLNIMEGHSHEGLEPIAEFETTLETHVGFFHDSMMERLSQEYLGKALEPIADLETALEARNREEAFPPISFIVPSHQLHRRSSLLGLTTIGGLEIKVEKALCDKDDTRSGKDHERLEDTTTVGSDTSDSITELQA
ncbi:hypothetical protein BC829DRAFT_439983 [Chytridium lagenaria]|nr:hypothetical protein BC829DRAFT_439983 [Chytridium lagenaria]